VDARSQAEPVAAVGAVVLDEEERVLLVKRGRPPGAGQWSLPGGRIEGDELPAEAVVREVREETGVEARVVCTLGVVAVASEGHSFAIHGHLLVPVSPSQDPRPADDAADARWVGPAELGALALTSDVLGVIQRARSAWLPHPER
jgi:ADP-ribose pyrophosphatase YjhB (NUDIX family)